MVEDLRMAALVQWLDAVLVPVAPSPLFRRQLRADLVGDGQRPYPPLVARISQRRLWWSAAIVGSVLSLTGVGVWWKRRQGVVKTAVVSQL